MSQDTSYQSQSLDWQKLLFSFEGRTRRSHFWIGWLICLGAGVVAGWIPFIGILLSIALIWPNLAISVKRLHDMGHAGWLVIVPWLVSVIGTIAAVSMMGISALSNASALEDGDPTAILGLLGPALGLIAIVGVVSLGFLLWIGLSDSQAGENRYGPNPKNPTPASTFN